MLIVIHSHKPVASIFDVRLSSINFTTTKKKMTRFWCWCDHSFSLTSSAAEIWATSKSTTRQSNLDFFCPNQQYVSKPSWLWTYQNDFIYSAYIFNCFTPYTATELLLQQQSSHFKVLLSTAISVLRKQTIKIIIGKKYISR